MPTAVPCPHAPALPRLPGASHVPLSGLVFWELSSYESEWSPPCAVVTACGRILSTLVQELSYFYPTWRGRWSPSSPATMERAHPRQCPATWGGAGLLPSRKKRAGPEWTPSGVSCRPSQREGCLGAPGLPLPAPGSSGVLRPLQRDVARPLPGVFLGH